MTAVLRAKLERAREKEQQKARALALAAIDFADARGGKLKASGDAIHALQLAARAWTNAYHEASRCGKHLRDAGAKS